MDSVAHGYEITQAASLRRTLDDLDEAMAREGKTTVEYAAIASFLHSLYTGVEGLLKHRLRVLGHDVPQSERWHQDLLTSAGCFGLIGAELQEDMQGFLSFRHFFMHAYPFMLDAERLLPLAPRARRVVEEVLRRLNL